MIIANVPNIGTNRAANVKLYKIVPRINIALPIDFNELSINASPSCSFNNKQETKTAIKMKEIRPR